MSDRETCGYRGAAHYCGHPPVQFISRYRETSDYCVNGVRISIHDNGGMHSTCHEVTDAERRALWIYSLEQYADYCRWHAEQRAKHGDAWPTLAPFDALGLPICSNPDHEGDSTATPMERGRR